MSASEIGLPNRGLGDPDWLFAAVHPMDANIRPASTPAQSLRDRIFHLPFFADRPGEDAVVVLDEASQSPPLRDFGDGRLHIAGAVDRAARDLCGPAVPVPDITEAREAFVQDRFL